MIFSDKVQKNLVKCLYIYIYVRFFRTEYKQKSRHITQCVNCLQSPANKTAGRFAWSIDPVPASYYLPIRINYLQPDRGSRHKSIIFMKANSEKQAQPYVKPEVELIDINPAGVICMSGGTTGQNPDAPYYPY